MNIYEESIEFHRTNGGKLDINPKFNITSKHDLSLAYTPGVAGVCEAIAKDPSLAYELTIKKNTVAIVLLHNFNMCVIRIDHTVVTRN